MASEKSAVKVVLGTMTFGEAGIEGGKVSTVQDVEAFVDLFIKHGHQEVDTARVYALGTCEQLLGQVNKDLRVGTKVAPLIPIPGLEDFTAKHTLEGLRKRLMESLAALNTKQIEIFYLHAPDRSVPYEETLKAIDELYREGHFKRWGMSHFAAWEVAEIVGICKLHGYIQPSVYQGIYNAIHRDVEPELFPALRKFGMSFYAFNPLACGLFTDRYTSIDAKPEKGSRLDPEGMAAKAYRARYWKPAYFDALAKIRSVANANGLTMVEVALRWMSHHSLLQRESGDAIIIAASSLEHLEQNLVDLEKGPLPEEIVKELDTAWAAVRGESSAYHSHPSLRK
ncbi:aflatoxin B1 aldehyde reductase member 3 [Favolaschia claudopus]|uniref:Aflatoxin B1 aldehyde reductase member 3 n=1 Tax=Favolaschia claudopus TaxID=2862362 RepID=A0AAW0BY74_9AGAR